MDARPLGVVDIARLGREIGLIAVEGFGNRDRTAVVEIIAGLAPSELAGGVDGLPIGEHRAAVARFKVVGQPDALDPINAGAGDTNVPGAGIVAIAPVADVNVRRYFNV